MMRKKKTELTSINLKPILVQFRFRNFLSSFDQTVIRNCYNCELFISQIPGVDLNRLKKTSLISLYENS